MGDAQSAQRDDKRDAAAEEEEESGTVDEAPTEEQTIEDKSLKNKGQLSEINGKADSSVPEVNGLCEEEIAAEAILSPDEDVAETEKPLTEEEETPLENVEINEKESSNEADANEDVPLETIEMDAKQNDINESFRRFFSNIGLKLTVKRGSGDIATDVPDDTNKEEPNRPEDVEDTAKETTSMNAEQNTAQETYDNDSTTCPTLTDVTSEDVLENAEEKTTETKEEVESDNANAAMTSPVEEDALQDSTPEEQPHFTSPSSPQEEVVVSPIKRFFTTGIFSGLRKKKKPAEDETPDKELEDMGKKEAVEMTEQTVQDQQQDKEDISLGVEAAAIETEHKENAAQTTDASTIIVTEPEIEEIQILSSQEKDKVPSSPLKRLLSGSSLKKLSKKQRSRKSSDAKLSDSGEHVSDQFISSTESAENQKEEGGAQPSAEAAGEEDGAWASFKKLVTPKKRMKRSSLSNEGTQIPGSAEETKPSEGGQISDHSTEEGKKRKDSSVSWDSVLCGSGRRRSRKTSDSEDESPQADNNINKQGGGSKHGAESAQESSNEVDEILAYSPKQEESPSEGDGGSTWKSLKRLVTPKRKVKDEDESKDNVQSDSEGTQDESSFSIKKLLPGRKKRKSVEKQDQASSDEADKDAASGDEDSDTPAVVPLSEFDTVETEVHIQTQADVESHIPKEADSKLQQDLLDQMAEPVLPCDSLQTEAKKVQDDDALENKTSTTPAKKEEPDDSDTESISKQQLSDIPEEATPASATEEAARDDTIAEDLVEITSEAITAPEPLDTTLADETEMVSAVSQLSSESSKTSGNTTPVPAEYVVTETDALLHQVVENISISPKARTLDATDVNTVQNVEELDAITELAATTQTESTSEVNDSVSTEIVSEVATEEFDTAEIAVDEVHDADVTHPEESLKELESIDDHLMESLSEANVAVSTDLLPKGDKIVSDEGSLVEAHQTETEPPKMDSQEADSAETVADETKDGAMEQEVQSLTEKEDQIMHNITDQIQAVEVEELQELGATQAAALDSEEGRVQSLEKETISEDIPATETAAYKLKEETVPLTEINVEPEKEDELDAAKPEHDQEPEAPEAVQASTLDSEEGSVQSPKEEVKSEIPPVETVDDESKQTAERLTEVGIEPENKELPANAIKDVQEREVLETVQAPTLDSVEGSVQSPKEEVKSVDTPPAETVRDEPKEETIPLTGANLEPVEDSKEPEVLEAIQAPTLDSEEGSVQSSKEEVKPEDTPPAETITDEPKEETIPFTGANLEPVDTSQEPEVLEAIQAPTLDSVEGSVQSSKEEVKPEDTPPAETVRDEPKEETIPLTGANLETVDASKEPEVLEAIQAPTLDSEVGSVQSSKVEVKSEDTPPAETIRDEPKEETIPLTGANLEPVDTSQEPEVLEAIQAPTLDSEEGSVQSSKEEVKSEDTPPAETVRDEPKEETIPLTGANLEPEDASKEPEVLEAIQAPTLDSEEGSVQSSKEEVKSEDTPPAETVRDEPKEETIPLTGANLEPEDASKEPEVLEAIQAPTLDSEEGSVQSSKVEVKPEDTPPAETITDEPKEETIPFTGANLEPVDGSQEPEVFRAPTLDSAEGSIQSLEKEVISEEVPEAETITDDPKDKTIPTTEVNLEPVDASKGEHVQEPEILQAIQEPEVLQAVQASKLDSEEGSVQSLEKVVILEDAPGAETITDEPKQTAECLTEVSVEPENKELPANAIKTVQEPAVLKSVQAPMLDSEEASVQSLEKEVISENVPEAETITEERKEETIPQTGAKPEPVDASKTEHVQEPEVLESVQAPTLDSEGGRVQSLEKEVISENVPDAKTVTDEPKEEITPLSGANLEPVDASKTEHVQESEELQAVQSSTLDSEEVQSLEKEVISEDAPEAETVTDKPKEETLPLNGADVEPVDASKTEQLQEPEVLRSIQAPTLDSEEVQSLEKEVISEDAPEAETVADEPSEETTSPIKVNVEPVDTSKAEHVQEPEVLQVVQAATVDSEVGSLLSLEKEEISEDIPAVETVTDELKQGTEVDPEEKLPVEAAKTEHVQEPEVLEAVQAATVDSEVSSLLSLEKDVISEDIPALKKVTEEPKQETEVDPEEKLPVEADKTEHVQEPEVLQAATLDSEVGSLLSLEKDVISEDIPAVEKVTDEPKQKTEVDPEEKLPVEAAKTEHVQEPEVLQAATLDSEVGSLLSLEKDVISEDIPAVEKVTDETKQKTEVNPEDKLPVEAAKIEHVQEPEVLQSDVKDIVTETKIDEGTSIYVTESIEGGSTQELAKQILPEDIPKPDVVASVKDGLDSEVVAQLDHSLETAKDQQTESIPQYVRVEQEDSISEVVEELQILTAVCVSSVNEEASNVQVLEKIVFTGETPAPCLDNAAVLIEKTSSSTEPLIDRVASELLVKEVETATPLVKEDASETAKEGSVVMMMHVPSVEFEDNHKIQVQVVGDDIESAETIVDTVLEVGVTEAKEVIDVCHETVKKVDNLSATPEIEEELINEENKVTIQEVIQHAKENLPVIVPESVDVNLEQEGIKQPDEVTEVSEVVESESNEVKDQKVMEESIATQAEVPTVISDVPTTEQQVSEDLMQRPDIPGSLDVSIQDQKDDLEEQKKTEAGVAVEEVKSNQIIQEGAQIIQKSDCNILVAPQNTGIISSTGNVESLSSLSIESKLANAPASPLPTTEGSEPVKKTDVSEVGVQAVEEVEPVKPTKQVEPTEVAVQATEITEPAEKLYPMERAVIMAQPVLLDINIQAMETVEPLEQIKSTERVTSSVQAAETIQPVRQTEKREVFLSPPVLSEACDQETEAEEAVKQKEEDQDVWMDAEEDICTQKETEVSLLEVEEYLEPQKESEQKEKAGQEVEMAPKSKTEAEDSQQEMYKTATTCEIDSDSEDFAVALEHPETETVSVTTTEWN